ncbi:MAG: hypothetical protein HYY01_06805 [Chloroflexi bacterium]|nr:hypothetical protein [Chloroflexota bacterium]
MAELKSAFEKAMEKVKDLEKASPEDMRRLELVPKGETMAARFLRDDIADLAADLAGHPDVSGRRYLTEGAQDALLRNICLPRDSRTKTTNAKAIQGVLALKKNSRRVKESFEQVEHLFTYYEAAVRQTYDRMKQEFEAKFAETRKAMEQQYGGQVRMDVERHPQFQEELRRAMGALDQQYEKVLEEHKQRIRQAT